MHTFSISDVALAREPLATTTFAESLGARLGPAVEAGAANLPGLVKNVAHPFVGAVHHAFAGHYPLVLSPDDVWLCIAQAFALHVDVNAEALRKQFVRHQGKVDIEVIRDEFVKGSPDNDWPGVFAEFSDAIAKHIGKKRDLVVANFSTTGPVERAASEVVLMAAMRRYFDYTVITRCGIPRVTLLGAPDDWRSIRLRAAVLAEFGLERWVNALLPVLDQLVAAALGRPDVAFWKSFYKYKDMSGGPYVTGWINVLFPYLESSRPGVLQQNEAALAWADGMDEESFGGGPGLHALPSGLSTVPFIWKYLRTRFDMELVAGFVGVSQAPETLAVRPAIGWAVRGASTPD